MKVTFLLAGLLGLATQPAWSEVVFGPVMLKSDAVLDAAAHNLLGPNKGCRLPIYNLLIGADGSVEDLGPRDQPGSCGGELEAAVNEEVVSLFTNMRFPNQRKQQISYAVAVNQVYSRHPKGWRAYYQEKADMEEQRFADYFSCNIQAADFQVAPDGRVLNVEVLGPRNSHCKYGTLDAIELQLHEGGQAVPTAYQGNYTIRVPYAVLWRIGPTQ